MAESPITPAIVAEHGLSTEEYQRVLHCPAPDVLGAFGAAWSPEAGRHDFFLIYVPEDRLSIAGPLAVELAKRRLSVAFSEYEVASRDELDSRRPSPLESVAFRPDADVHRPLSEFLVHGAS